MDGPCNVLSLLKGEDRYVFLYDTQSIPQLMQTLGRFAADPELSFSWADAATLSAKVPKNTDTEKHDE